MAPVPMLRSQRPQGPSRPQVWWTRLSRETAPLLPSMSGLFTESKSENSPAPQTQPGTPRSAPAELQQLFSRRWHEMGVAQQGCPQRRFRSSDGTQVLFPWLVGYCVSHASVLCVARVTVINGPPSTALEFCLVLLKGTRMSPPHRTFWEFLLWLSGLRTQLVSMGCGFDPWPDSVG